MTLGQRIQELRKQRGMSQEALGDALGVSRQAVSKWENNLSCPDISLLPAIAKIFGMSVDELLGAASATENIAEAKPYTESESKYEEPVFTGKKATTLLITTERNGKVSNVRFPLTIMRFGLNLGSTFGGLTGSQASTIENAIRTGLSGEILSVDGENGEKVTISLV